MFNALNKETDMGYILGTQASLTTTGDAHMNATETQDKVSEILSAAQVSFAATYCGQTKRDDWDCDSWRIRLSNGKQIFETDYFTGLGHRKAVKGAPADKGRPNTLYREQWERAYLKPQSPKAADVLHSLTSDAQANGQSFDDWCADFGYSDDSLKPLETYRACCKTAKELRRIFKPETLAAIREALADY